MRNKFENMLGYLKSPAMTRIEIVFAIFAGGFLAGRASFLDNMFVCGEGYIAASALMGVGLPAAGLGVLIGRLTMGINMAMPLQLIPSTLIFCTTLLIGLTKYRPARRTYILMCIIARIPILIFTSFLLYDILMFTISTIISAAVAFLFTECAYLLKMQRYNTNIILFILAGALLFSGLPPTGGTVSLFVIMCCIVTLFTSISFGAFYSASAGCALGIVGMLSGGFSLGFAGILGGAGLFCGAIKKTGKVMTSLMFCAMCMLISMLSDNTLFSLVSYQAMIIASVMCIIVPKSIYSKLENMNISETEEFERWKIADMISKKFDVFAECLSSLRSVFDDVSDQSDETWNKMAPVIEVACEQTCKDCNKKDRCWNVKMYDTYRALCSALVSADEKKVLKKEDVDKEFIKRCQKPQKLVNSLSSAYSAYRMQSAIDKKIMQSRETVKEHLSGACAILNDMSVGIKKSALSDDFMLAGAALKRSGANISSLEVVPQGLIVCAKSCGGTKRCNQMARDISAALDKNYIVKSSKCGGATRECRINIGPAEPLRVMFATAQKALSGASCGDAFTTKRLYDGSVLLAIADGMGAGARASLEAGSTLDLFMSFIEAGFDEDIVFSIINRALALRSSSEMFTTIDVCLIDPSLSQYKFLKVGAPPSYIIRGDKIISVHSPSLPLGILDNVMPVCIKRQAMPGDIILMASDGFDAAKYQDCIMKYSSLPPSRMARQLMIKAEDAEAPDDTTIITAKVKSPLLAKKQNDKGDWKNKIAI